MNSIRPVLAVLFLSTAFLTTLAADVTPPAEVGGLLLDKSGGDAVLSWDAVTLDAAGGAETVASYRVYRGATPDFVADKTGGSNRIGSPSGTTFTDVGALSGPDAYYLVSAVDAAGNEGRTEAPLVTSVPVLSGSYTDTTIELNWTAGQPSGQVQKYLVYTGVRSRVYDSVKDVGLATSTTMTGLAPNTNYYFAVVAVDVNGNASDWSNEHVDVLAGRLAFKAHDQDYICWGASKCPPDPGEVQRSDGWQLMVPVDFPEGDWTKVELVFTMDSRLCTEGQNGCTTRCGTDPAQGGYNPCGDPWDRTATVFLVVDETCITSGGSCANHQNLELMHAITPFGTDAPPPAGRGIVPPRVLTYDITPFVPLLQGRKYVGAEIGHFVQAGWWVTTEFKFTKRPEEASPKPPADGFQLVGFGGAPLPVRQVTIPPTATSVFARIFTTGHGGTLYCDGGSNNGAACTSNANCPGGTCQNCDEFCHRTNRLLKNGSPIWQAVPFRLCGYPFNTACSTWNSCGFPSCMFDRAGWCPGYLACHSEPPCDQDVNLTSSLPPGGTYDLSYDVLVQRGSWAVSVVVYWYE